jgi:hypothetical protein
VKNGLKRFVTPCHALLRLFTFSKYVLEKCDKALQSILKVLKHFEASFEASLKLKNALKRRETL